MLWVGVVVLVGGLVGVQQWMSQTSTKRERVKLNQNNKLPTEQKTPPPPTKATMAPGRVLQLDTAKGRIDIVLFEKDCPKTTSRIVSLAKQGCYNGIPFPRVEKTGLIQTSVCEADVPTMPLEVRDGLINTKGAVGMARKNDPDSATSSFYILTEPWRHLDYSYTVFGRLIRGMDVVQKIKKGDPIKRAAIRDFTTEDRKQFNRVLIIEAERKTE